MTSSSHMKCLGGALLLALAACAPGAAGTDDVSDDANLINGALDTEHVNVLRIQTLSGFCTATLIGSRTLLTAAHCFEDQDPVGMVSVGEQSVAFHSATLHPGWIENGGPGLTAKTDGLPRTLSGYDFAVAHLDRPITGIEPALLLIDDSPRVGETVTMVGYGHTNGGKNDGARRAGQNTIAKVTTRLVETDGSDSTHATADIGDSGGPGFVERGGRARIAGVASAVKTTCLFGIAGCYLTRYARVDAAADWIASEAGDDLYDGVHYDPRPLERPPTASLAIGSPDRIIADEPFSLWVQSSGDPLGLVTLQIDGALTADTDAKGASTITWTPTLTLAQGTHTCRVEVQAVDGRLVTERTIQLVANNP